MFGASLKGKGPAWFRSVSASKRGVTDLRVPGACHRPEQVQIDRRTRHCRQGISLRDGSGVGSGYGFAAELPGVTEKMPSLGAGWLSSFIARTCLMRQSTSAPFLFKTLGECRKIMQSGRRAVGRGECRPLYLVHSLAEITRNSCPAGSAESSSMIPAPYVQ